ncbi:MAG: glucose 1-dehydrogenase [Acidobacteriia bacterium]|nr:glucose 1-dehydrogenase [Terriglobia bacterium]
MRLRGKVAVITGAGRGIGRASAIRFAEEGAKVTVVDIRCDLGEETVQRIRDAGGEAHHACTDVTKEDEVKAMLDDTVARWGRLDILFNNAGIVAVKFLEEMSEAEWDRLMNVNVKSVFLAVKHAVGHMRKQGGGTILNTASIGSFVGQFKTPAYIASKGAVMLLTKSLALDYAADNIRVNCVCPGVVDTPMVREHLEASGDADARARERAARIPLGRFLTSEEIAQAALYLVSDEAAGVTGVAHVVDGGLLASFEYDGSWAAKEKH